MKFIDSYHEYLNKKKKFDEELTRERQRLLIIAIAEIKSCVDLLGINKEDIFPSDPIKITKRKAKYYDPTTGKTWSGVGREPTWMRGRNKRDFLIEPE